MAATGNGATPALSHSGCPAGTQTLFSYLTADIARIPPRCCLLSADLVITTMLDTRIDVARTICSPAVSI
jgi:hypothetical protein